MMFGYAFEKGLTGHGPLQYYHVLFIYLIQAFRATMAHKFFIFIFREWYGIHIISLAAHGAPPSKKDETNMMNPLNHFFIIIKGMICNCILWL